VILEAGPGLCLELSPRIPGEIGLVFEFPQHFFQVAVDGVKANSKQHFYSLCHEPEKGQAAGAKDAVYLEFKMC
jgi:hypothetical protein